MTIFQSTLCEAPVFLSPSSSLLQLKAEFVVFQELMETSKLYMREVTAIDGSWLPKLLPEHCTFSAPLDLPSPSFDNTTGTIYCHMTCTYGTYVVLMVGMNILLLVLRLPLILIVDYSLYVRSYDQYTSVSCILLLLHYCCPDISVIVTNTVFLLHYFVSLMLY